MDAAAVGKHLKMIKEKGWAHNHEGQPPTNAGATTNPGED